MRGRTNVMQRTGATVNGNIINAEVAGGPIAIGDFVKWKSVPVNSMFDSDATHMDWAVGGNEQINYHNRFEHMHDNIYMLMLSDMAMLVDITGGFVTILDTFNGISVFCKLTDTKMLFIGATSGGTYIYLTDISNGTFNVLSRTSSRIGNLKQQRAICKLAPHKYIHFVNNLTANRLYANIIVLNNDDTEITTVYKVSAKIGYVGDGLYRLDSETPYLSERIEAAFYGADYKVGIITNFCRYAWMSVDSSISGDVTDETGTMFIINDLTYSFGISSRPSNGNYLAYNMNVRPDKNMSGNKGLIAGYVSSYNVLNPNFSILQFSNDSIVEKRQVGYTNIAGSSSGTLFSGTCISCDLTQIKDNVYYICIVTNQEYYKLQFIRLEWDEDLQAFTKSNVAKSNLSGQNDEYFGCFAEDTDGNVVYLHRQKYQSDYAIFAYRLTYRNGLLSIGSTGQKVEPFSGDAKLAIGFAKTGGAIGDTIQVYTPA